MRARILPFLLILLLAPKLATAWDVILHENRRYVPVENVSKFYNLSSPKMIADGFVMTSTTKTIKGKSGAREVFINNVKYVLGFPIVNKGGKILISAMDVTKIIEPVLRPGLIKNASPVSTVILDAGHGGNDSGAKGARGIEKEAALDVVLRAKRLLQERGYKVQLTRSNDTFIPLEGRPAIANRYQNAVFVSVHFNKSNTVGGTGIETFALAPRGVPSMDEENLSYNDLKPYPGHAQDSQNVALATAMHSSMLRHMRLTDRGIKRARFVVIRDLNIPGVLLEGGFMNHPTDARLIASSSYRDAFARAILEGVTRYGSAVAGKPNYQEPSAATSAVDPTTIPNLRKSLSPYNLNTGLNEAVQRAAQQLATPSATANPPIPNAN
ncbi:MAG: N-acetylmuramoyl-L-alanine amidase [bacterium]